MTQTPREKETPDTAYQTTSSHTESSAYKSIVTPANIVTFIRVVASFVWLGAATGAAPVSFDTFSLYNCMLLVFFVFICATDSLDGYLARSKKHVSVLGQFLDPIADKLICFAGLLILLQWNYIDVWVLFIILAREFLVATLRMMVAQRGIVVAADVLGKVKTVFTIVAISILLGAAAGLGVEFGAILYVLGEFCIAVAVVLTIISGINYTIRCVRTYE